MLKIDLDVTRAYWFYRRYLLDLTTDKKALYEEYGFKVAGSVLSRDWELFAAILLKDRAKMGDGADLMRHEVKSAIYGNSFEYQYHKFHGEYKLAEDKRVDHIFISYSPDYFDIEVRHIPGEQLALIFDSWLTGLITNYAGENPRQRYRRSISFGTVKRQGTLLLQIQAGELTFTF